MKAEDTMWLAQSVDRSLGFRRALALSLAGLGVLFATLLAGPVSTSLASEHTEITGEYGKEGPKSSGLGEGCRLGYNSSAERLYLMADGKIYGLSVSPGSATPLGGNFPVNAEVNTFCGDPDMDVDSGNGNIYAVQTSGPIPGRDSTGAKLASPWPVSVAGGGETCGIDTTATGEVWIGNYTQKNVAKFTAAGAANGTIPIGFQFCKLAINRANGDLFVAPYNSGEIVKFTAASGYVTQVKFPASGNNNPGLAVNGAENKLYVGSGSNEVKVYDTESAALVETVTLPEAGGRGIAVDEGTDTLFATVGSGASGYIVEYLGLTTPKATTGEPTGNSSVSGTADPNGVGPITECYFEYGETTAYGSKQNCEESVPFNSVQTVHATFSGLIGETTYHYRLVLTNGEPHVVGKGGDKTIIPHNVKGLTTEPATEITQESALLNAKFEGDGTPTHYYFEWGQTTNYGHKTAVPPGDYAGEPTGITTVSTLLTGLDEGTTYHYRVVGQNTTGVSAAKDKSFTTHEVPSIDSATTSHLTATSADIDITINPHEFETEYFVEYGPSIEYGSIAPVPSGVIAPANTAQAVTVHLTNLEGVLYHFRVVAENEWGQVKTEDQSYNFYPQDCPNSQVRQQNESQYLPDCRAFELVTPEETGNIVLGNAPSTPDTYATNPARFAYNGGLGGLKGTEPINGCSVDTYIATRSVSGWKSSYVGIRGDQAGINGGLYANRDLSRFLQFIETGCFEGEPQPRNEVPYIFDTDGNFLERWPANFESISGAEQSKGAFQTSPDMSHMAITSTNVEFAPGGQTTGVGSAYDYNTGTGEINLISLDEEGNPIQSEPGDTPSPPLGIFFPTPDWGETGGSVYFDNGGSGLPEHQKIDSDSPTISDDGTHILMATSSAPYGYFTRPRPPVRLYMSVARGAGNYDHYEVSKEKYVDYVGMTRDGSKVFFTSPEKLTGDDTDTSVDLYMWSEDTNELTLISKAAPLAEGTGNSDSCTTNFVTKCGIFPVFTETNSDTTITEEGEIYFFSPEQLDGSRGIPNRENLYVYRGGKPQFVASLDPTEVIPLYQGTGPLTRIQVSPDGVHMALITKSRLTGYDNAGKEEMYTYDAITRKIICVSCRPNGTAPAFNVEGSKAGRFMTDDGRAFFATQDPLLPTDTNEALDVYEFSEGRPQLITTGSGTSEAGEGSYGGAYSPPGAAGLAGVSADGVNVYFATRDVLVPQNHNGPFLAFYDARSGGGFPYVPPLAPCEAADECHGAGNAPPAAPGIASEGDLGDRGNAPNPPSGHHKSKRHKRHRRHHKRRHARHHRQGRS